MCARHPVSLGSSRTRPEPQCRSLCVASLCHLTVLTVRPRNGCPGGEWYKSDGLIEPAKRRWSFAVAVPEKVTPLRKHASTIRYVSSRMPAVGGDGGVASATSVTRRWAPVHLSDRLSRANGSYLVDPASSHMLVSKIKPCMSKHKPLHGEAANGSLGHP